MSRAFVDRTLRPVIIAVCLTAVLAPAAFASAGLGGPSPAELVEALARAESAEDRAAALAKSNRILRRQLKASQRKSRRRGAEIRRLRRAWRPTVEHAITLASVVYGVPEWELRSVGYCESRLSPGARNGKYRGVMQEGPMFERGRFDDAGLTVWDPYANVFRAAETVADEGWRQWACKP